MSVKQFFKNAWKPAANGSKGRATLRSFTESFEKLVLELDRDDKYLIYWTIHPRSFFASRSDPYSKRVGAEIACAHAKEPVVVA